MKRLIPYLILFTVLAALALYFTLGRGDGSYSGSDIDFAVQDTGRIEYVSIEYGGSGINLDRTAEGWLVNGKPARDESIRGFYVLVSRLEAEAPITGANLEMIKNSMQEDATRVEIGGSGGSIKSYRVIYDAGTDATYMMLENSEMVFRVRVRGYRQTDLQALYNPDPRFWRDNVLIQALPEEITSVSLKNRREPSNTFHLARGPGGDFAISRGSLAGDWTPPSPESLEQYLNYFYDVRFELFRDPDPGELENPDKEDMLLSIELSDGQSREIGFYPVSGDFHRLFAHLRGEDEWVLVKYVAVDPLLKDFEYFTVPKK